jgi:ABC-type nickel/cobalt efflux system permease component RcnA
MRPVRRLLATLATALTTLLVLAPAAGAMNDGRGFYGPTDDKVVTLAGFILIVFFPTFALLASLLQKRLEKRKDARVAAQRAHHDDERWQGGW